MKKATLILTLLLISLNGLAGLKVDKLGHLPKELYESSGLVFYKNKYLLTINDSGNEPIVYVINEQAQIVRRIQVNKAKNQDWEDICQSDDGRVFIGDIGNNYNTRRQCQIYILDEAFMNDTGTAIEAKRIGFTYEDQKAYPPADDEKYYDAEAMFWMNDSIYIFTKCRSKPFTGKSYVYVIPDEPGNYKARKIGEVPFCGLHWMFCSVTAADYYPETNTLAVLLYGKLALITNFPENRFWEGELNYYNIPKVKQREAIAFIDEKTWYLTDEYSKQTKGGNLYKIKMK